MVDKVTSKLKVVTDSLLLDELSKQEIDKDFVEFIEDYSFKHPYSKKYKDLKSNKHFLVSQGLPKVDAFGQKHELVWYDNGITIENGNNIYHASVRDIDVQVVILSDQPTGIKKYAALKYHPQMFIGGAEVKPLSDKPILLGLDPVNNNYQFNTLEWDYGICKRRLRLIEGGLIGYWSFNKNPKLAIKIKYNQSGDFRMNLGEFRANADEEYVSLDNFNTAFYPFNISDSATFYPDANPESTCVDGGVYYQAPSAQTWAQCHDAANGTAALPSLANSGNWTRCWSTTDRWEYTGWRIYTLFDTSALGAGAVVSVATLSLYGGAKAVTASGWTPTYNIYSAIPTTNTDLVLADYDKNKFGITAFSTAIAYASFSITGYNAYSLNASGIAAINASGITKMGWREATYDVADSAPPWQSGAVYVYIYIYCSEQGVGFQPKLVVTYTPGAGIFNPYYYLAANMGV